MPSQPLVANALSRSYVACAVVRCAGPGGPQAGRMPSSVSRKPAQPGQARRRAPRCAPAASGRPSRAASRHARCAARPAPPQRPPPRRARRCTPPSAQLPARGRPGCRQVGREAGFESEAQEDMRELPTRRPTKPGCCIPSLTPRTCTSNTTPSVTSTAKKGTGSWCAPHQAGLHISTARRPCRTRVRSRAHCRQAAPAGACSCSRTVRKAGFAVLALAKARASACASAARSVASAAASSAAPRAPRASASSPACRRACARGQPLPAGAHSLPAPVTEMLRRLVCGQRRALLRGEHYRIPPKLFPLRSVTSFRACMQASTPRFCEAGSRRSGAAPCRARPRGRAPARSLWPSAPPAAQRLPPHPLRARPPPAMAPRAACVWPALRAPARQPVRFLATSAPRCAHPPPPRRPRAPVLRPCPASARRRPPRRGRSGLRAAPGQGPPLSARVLRPPAERRLRGPARLTRRRPPDCARSPRRPHALPPAPGPEAHRETLAQRAVPQHPQAPPRCPPRVQGRLALWPAARAASRRRALRRLAPPRALRARQRQRRARAAAPRLPRPPTAWLRPAPPGVPGRPPRAPRPAARPATRAAAGARSCRPARPQRSRQPQGPRSQAPAPTVAPAPA